MSNVQSMEISSPLFQSTVFVFGLNGEGSVLWFLVDLRAKKKVIIS
mgnify:CR=1 FL=1